MFPMHLLLFSQNIPQDDGDAPTGAPFWWSIGCVALVVLAGVVLARTLFFVDQTQYVYVTQFGQPVILYTEAGLRVKWPYQSLRRFDRRLQMYEPPAREMLTEDKENLNFQWFVCWRIPDESFVADRVRATQEAADEPPSERQVADELEEHVKRFLQSVGTIETAESRLEERIQATIAAKIGQTRLEQLVSLQPDRLLLELPLETITAQVTHSIRDVAAEEFGIEVVDVRIKRFNYPDAVKPAVYAEIRSERERIAVQYRAEGASQKAKIESLADLKRDQILAQAQRDATSIRGQGEARAIEIFNAAHSTNPEFYELLKTLETYRRILDDQTTVVLSADSPLLKLLTRGLPNLTNPPPALPSSEDPPPTRPAPAAGANNGLTNSIAPRVAEQQDND